MRALITGAAGFVGKHLRDELMNNGYQWVFGLDSHDEHGSYKVDLRNYDEIRNLLFHTRPDVIFHLAGISFVPTSWQNAELVIQVNTIGTLNLFEAVRANKLDPVIQIAGSSEEYGLVHPSETPISESNDLRPLSTYAVSKIAMDMLGYQYFKSYGMKIIRTRAFNHEGYGRPETFMPSGFAKQAVEYKHGLTDVITHGDLSSKRDITDVRDMVRAYRLAVKKCKPGEVYNIGRGKSYSAKQVLKKIIKLVGLDNPCIRQDPSKMRPSDVPLLLCDYRKFVKATGWKPKYSLEDTLLQEIKYWEERIGVKNA